MELLGKDGEILSINPHECSMAEYTAHARFYQNRFNSNMTAYGGVSVGLFITAIAIFSFAEDFNTVAIILLVASLWIYTEAYAPCNAAH